MKNNRADGSKSRSNPAKNQTKKKARKSFFIPPNKEDGEKKNE